MRQSRGIWESGVLNFKLITAWPWANQFFLWPCFLICRLGVLNQKFSKGHSTSLTLLDRSLSSLRSERGGVRLPGYGGSALLVAQPFLLFPLLLLFLPSLFSLCCDFSANQPRKEVRSNSGSRKSPCQCHTVKLKRDLEGLGVGGCFHIMRDNFFQEWMGCICCVFFSKCHAALREHM